MKFARCGLPLILILLGALVGLVPLACASPPDPAWIGGLYDDDDYDDVVAVATSLKAPDGLVPLPVITSVTLVLTVLSLTEGKSRLSADLPAFETRAPPIY